MKNEIIKELIESNCIKFGSFILKSGEVSKYYYDMKNLISNPTLLKKIGDELYKSLDEFDIICGIPYLLEFSLISCPGRGKFQLRALILPYFGLKMEAMQVL